MNQDFLSRIKDALQRLPLMESYSECKFDTYASSILALVTATSSRPRSPSNFRSASAPNCVKELKRFRAGALRAQRLLPLSTSYNQLANAVAKLREVVRLFHQPTILVLADCGMSGDVRHALGDIDEEGFHQLPRLLEVGIAAADRALASPVDLRTTTSGELQGRKGRIEQQPNGILGDLLYAAFEELTGRPPTITVLPELVKSSASGPFLGLISDIFKIAGITASAEATARRAIATNR